MEKQFLRETVPQGDGEAAREGERETIPQGGEEGNLQGNSLSFEWISIGEFWKNQDSDPSHEEDVLSGCSVREKGIKGNLDSSSKSSDLPAGTKKCGVCNLVKDKNEAKAGTMGLCKGQGYCGDED